MQRPNCRGGCPPIGTGVGHHACKLTRPHRNNPGPMPYHTGARLRPQPRDHIRQHAEVSVVAVRGAEGEHLPVANPGTMQHA